MKPVIEISSCHLDYQFEDATRSRTDGLKRLESIVEDYKNNLTNTAVESATIQMVTKYSDGTVSVDSLNFSHLTDTDKTRILNTTVTADNLNKENACNLYSMLANRLPVWVDIQADNLHKCQVEFNALDSSRGVNIIVRDVEDEES